MENNSYAFIVRIWGEATDDAGNPIQWRGSIDQVGSNKRLYFSDLEGITRFIREQIQDKSDRSARVSRFKLIFRKSEAISSLSDLSSASFMPLLAQDT